MIKIIFVVFSNYSLLLICCIELEEDIIIVKKRFIKISLEKSLMFDWQTPRTLCSWVPSRIRNP